MLDIEKIEKIRIRNIYLLFFNPLNLLLIFALTIFFCHAICIIFSGFNENNLQGNIPIDLNELVQGIFTFIGFLVGILFFYIMFIYLYYNFYNGLYVSDLKRIGFEYVLKQIFPYYNIVTDSYSYVGRRNRLHKMILRIKHLENNPLYYLDFLGVFGKGFRKEYEFKFYINNILIICLEGDYYENSISSKHGFLFYIPKEIFNTFYNNFQNNNFIHLVNQDNKYVYLFLPYEYKLDAGLFRSMDTYTVNQIIDNSKSIIGTLLNFVRI
ncbi:MAG: hypothetical protein ACP5O4_07205 [bacterium]